MYTKFFGLNEKPFSITPDPRYLFMSERHSEGLAHLVYGVKDSSGFIQLTGEVGTGKTTLVRTLLSRIPKGVDVALVLNPQLSPLEFLSAICDELKINIPKETISSKTVVDALNQRLLSGHANGRRTILIIDEAQNLSTEVLEEVRLLTNLETAKQKLLQIILIAQPELRDKLSQTNLRQLAQRVTGRYHLEPLSKEDTARYIDHRLRVAGGLGDLFEDKAKREVYRHSLGVPRLINVICDRSLLGAYSQEIRKVTVQMVRDAASEVSGVRAGLVPQKRLFYLFGAVAILAVTTVIWMLAEMQDSSINAPDSVPLAVDEASDVMANTVTGEVAQPSLDGLLRSYSGSADNNSAIIALLTIWGIEPDPGAAEPCAQAASNGLRCLSKRGSWTAIQQLNRPVALSLTDSLGQTRKLLLVAIDDKTAHLRLGEQPLQASVDEVTSLWFGEYTLLWEPPNGDPAVLRVGSRGQNVRWLRQSLVALDPDFSGTISNSDEFDDELRSYLMQFQQRNRLETDGIAGEQTQIIINTQLGLDGRPTLSGS